MCCSGQASHPVVAAAAAAFHVLLLLLLALRDCCPGSGAVRSHGGEAGRERGAVVVGARGEPERQPMSHPMQHKVRIKTCCAS